ncbi:MAG: ATP-dependent zinc protease [Planctomycetaceae bacterium]
MAKRRRDQARVLPAVGWREWVALPDLGVNPIKAKLDTGARTSSLHAFEIEEFTREGTCWVRFAVHPLQRVRDGEVWAESPLVEYRTVRSSSGHAEKRPVIKTSLRLGDKEWEIELTLANRDAMGFRMLLGREALRGRVLIDAGLSYLTSRPPKKK